MSEVIKELMLNYLEDDEENKKTPYELGMQYFGKVKTGNKNGSVEYKSIISEKIKVKFKNKKHFKNLLQEVLRKKL